MTTDPMGLVREKLGVAENAKDARCPAHEDRRASLSITQGRDGRALLRCHAGCTLEAIVGTLGLTIQDLFPKNRDERRQKRRAEIVESYNYRDERGELLFQVVRFEPKDFRQRRPLRPDDDAGRLRHHKINVDSAWVWSLNRIEIDPQVTCGSCEEKGHCLSPIRRVLYRLPELLASDPRSWVFVVEGEKDAERLAALGLVATTNPGGAEKWRSEYSESLRGRRVVLLPDNDDAGGKHAHGVAGCLPGVAREVRIVELPGLPKKGDATDWLDAGGAKDKLLALVAAAKPRIRDVLKREEMEEPEAKRETRVVLAFTRVGDLLAEPDDKIEWVVDELLSESGLSAMVSKPKVGKSTLARCLALATARGEPVLGRETTKGPVLYLALEESKRQVKAHFRALGATEADDVHVFAGAAPADVLLELRAAVAEYRPVLVIIDTLFRLTRVKDANAYAEVTAALDPLLALARDLGAHVMVLHHSPKGDARQAVEAALGSIAITGSVDIVMALRKNDRFRTIISEQREGAGFPEEVTLDFDEETHRVTLGPTRKAADADDVARAILEWLAGQTEAAEEKAIHEAVEGRKTTKVKALRSLVDDGRALRTGAGKKGDPYLYQAAPEFPEESSFPGSHHMWGTRKPESSNGSEPRTNSGEKVVPAASPSSEEFRNQKPVAEDDGKWGEP